MLLYDPARKLELSMSTVTTSTDMSPRRLYVLYDPRDEELQSLSLRAPSVEVRENGAVVHAVHCYYEKGVLEDSYDYDGIRHGTWDSGICRPRVWLPMTCGIVVCLPSIAIAQMRVRLGRARYGVALTFTLLRFLAIASLPIVSAFAFGRMKAIPSDHQQPTVTTPIPTTKMHRETLQSIEATAWMVLFWVSSLTVVLLLLIEALALHDLRSKIRQRYQIPGSRGNDLCAVACLPTCAIAQMSMHLRCLRPEHYTRVACPEVLPPYTY